jgi:hypothetical protein
MASFNVNDYDPVENRIHEFWKDHELGRIHTEIVLINETEIVIKATVYADRDDPRPVAVGFAQESRKSDPVSFAEKCETSAIGRALANMGYSPNLKNKFLRASREEMEKVQRGGAMQNDRDWELELDVLTTEKNLVGLRALRKDAVKSLQPMELIVKIDAAGKLISDTP